MVPVMSVWIKHSNLKLPGFGNVTVNVALSLRIPLDAQGSAAVPSKVAETPLVPATQSLANGPAVWPKKNGGPIGGPEGGPTGGGGVGRAVAGDRKVTVCGSFWGIQVHVILSVALIHISFTKKPSACTAWSLVSAPTLAVHVTGLCAAFAACGTIKAASSNTQPAVPKTF